MCENEAQAYILNKCKVGVNRAERRRARDGFCE